MEKDKYLLAVLALAGLLTIASTVTGERGRKREGKFMNVFQVISFQNGPCEGSGSRNGTCYTEQECEAKGGTNGGSCASGFGVCCTFSINCGERSTENCTYFESSGVTAGSCTAEICPCNDNICQLRLDFDTFTITGPSTSVAVTALRRAHGGDVTVDVVATTKKVSLTEFGQCLTDTFFITNPEGPNPPTICGTNSGEHMYVESSECCNKLNFALGNNGVGAAVANRAWTIKVTQYSCNYPNLAPQGCVQYFFESTSSNVRSFNYNNGNGIHLANQDQSICVRRERNNCRICWYANAVTDFAVTAGTKNMITSKSIRNANRCCDYGAPSSSTKLGFDCVFIPGNQTPDAPTVGRVSVFCGHKGLKGGSNCSTRTPFQLNFRSDKFEPLEEVQANGPAFNRGFQLGYTMDSIGCNPAGTVNAAG